MINPNSGVISADYEVFAESRGLFRKIFATDVRPSKRAFDVLMCLALMPVLLISAAMLLLLNPFFNRGSLFFVQTRMGKDCRPFKAFKFRSMTAAPAIERGAFDALDVNRITRLGEIMRKSRIDELPQILNVLLGDMSMIGPRPDYYDHAVVYVRDVRGYRERHAVLPGISGYAQTKVGYVDGLEGLRRKVAADLLYIRRESTGFDMWITWRTICTVFGRQGA